jgi:hypothetical protein
LPLASFLDKDHVPLAIVGGYLVLIFVVWALTARGQTVGAPGNAYEARRPALGCITGIGLFVLLAAMALTDWLIDAVF